MAKTVYILGAGFSKSAGIPTQSEILRSILNEDKLKEFMQNGLGIIDKGEDGILRIVDDYFLEDIYTPLDRCISENIPFHKYSVKDLIEIRSILNNKIASLISSSGNKRRRHIKKFAKYVYDCSKNKEKDTDPIAVITTNWDTLLDDEIQDLIVKSNTNEENSYGVLDYCCYVSSFDDDDNIKPGLYAIGKGGYNVKLLKLHGSLNWFQCPHCERLYVSFEPIKEETYCKHCTNNYGTQNQLRRNMIMPTFLKDLTNFQNKLVWRNAGVELSEADKIVFIGYSLPMADFEFKLLLSRTIKKEAKIEVHLAESDNPENNKESQTTAGYRYQVFFHGHKPTIYYKKLKGFVKDIEKQR